MTLNRLFGALVVGGSLLVAGACDDDDGDDGGRELVGGIDATAGAPVDASPTAAADASELAPCFCDTQACCQRDEAGAGTVQEGFECCWSTTC